MAELDPSLLYPSMSRETPPEPTARMKGEPAEYASLYPSMRADTPLEPTARIKAEAVEYASMYPSMRADIERDLRVKLPPDATPSAEPGAAPVPEESQDYVAGVTLAPLIEWAREARIEADLIGPLRDSALSALQLPRDERARHSEAWASEARSALGTRLEEVVRAAQRAVPESLKPLLDLTGLGNRVDVIRFFAKRAGVEA